MTVTSTPIGAKRLKLTLLSAPAWSGIARESIRRYLERWNRPDLVDRVTTVASELISNVIVHTDSPWFWVTMDYIGPIFELQVIDTSTDLPQSPKTPQKELTFADIDALAVDEDWKGPGEGEGGNGLLVVQALSDEWGSYRFEQYSGVGKSVWAKFFDRADRCLNTRHTAPLEADTSNLASNTNLPSSITCGNSPKGS